MRWQDVKDFGLGIFKKRNRSRTLWISGPLSIFSVIALIILLTGVSVTYTGDITCGTECVSYFNVTSTYWRICFADDFELIQTNPDVPVDVYVPARGKGNWRLFDHTKDCIERKNKYNYLPNRFKIVGHKKASETIKWSVDKFDIDPIWIGFDNKLNFKEKELEVNFSLESKQGDSFTAVPSDYLFMSGKKFGADIPSSALSLAKADTSFRYNFTSNKEIKYDDGYYYSDEGYAGSNQFMNYYTRVKYNVNDICTDVYYNETNITTKPNCVFKIINNSLIVDFVSFYDAKSDKFFIDPEFEYLNVTTEATLTANIRSEDIYSHLLLNESSLVLYMPFDVNQTTDDITYDYSVNDNDGTGLNGVTWNSTGYIGGAYDFDGDDDYVDLSAVVTTVPFSVCAWFKSSSDSTNQNIISFGDTAGDSDAFVLSVRGDVAGDYIRAQVNRDSWGDAITTTGYTIDKWHHVCAVFTSSTLREVYIDAGSKGTDTTDLTPLSIDSGAIGRLERASPTAYFNGTIDEVMIFNRSLSAFEVGQLYNYTFQKFYKDGNQTFNLTEVSLGTDNRVNVTVKGEALNDSGLKARVYTANLTDSSNPSASYVNTDASTDNSLVGYWHFDNWSSYGENNTHVYDFSGNGNNGTWNGTQNTTCSAKYGEDAGCFNGVNDYVDTKKPLSTFMSSTEGSISLWFYAKEVGDAACITNALTAQFVSDGYTNGQYIQFFYDSTGSVCAKIFGGDGISTPASLNTWHHAVWVHGDGKLSIYIDGQYKVETASDGITLMTHIVTMGVNYKLSRFFNGSMDEVMMFNRTLSAQEIKSLYLTGSTDHKNDGVGINWTESSTGTQELTTFNSSHLQASGFVVESSSEYLLTEIEFNSTYGFYSGIVEDVGVDSYFVTGILDTTPPAGNLTTITNNSIYNATKILIGSLWNETGDLRMYINWTLNQTELSVTTGTNFTFITNLSNGTYLVNMTNTDAGSNIGETPFMIFEIANNTGVEPPPVDSCSCPASGDWAIDCSDNCVITSDCDMQGNDVSVSGTGTLDLFAMISNLASFTAHNPDCIATCRNAVGCFG